MIKQLKKQSGLTRAKFAELLGVSIHTFKSYHQNRIAIPEKRIERAKEIVRKIREI